MEAMGGSPRSAAAAALAPVLGEGSASGGSGAVRCTICAEVLPAQLVQLCKDRKKPFYCEGDRLAVQQIFEQARAQGQLEKVQKIRTGDPAEFTKMVLEIKTQRPTWLDCTRTSRTRGGR